MDFVLSRGPWFGRGLIRAAAAANHGMRAYLTYKIANRKLRYAKRNSGGGARAGVTQQHDTSVQYRKRNQPRRKKSKWVKFVKKVKAVTEKGVGTQNFLFNDTTTVTASGGNQAVTSMMLYGGSLSSEVVNTRGYSDINKIMNIVSPTAGNSANVSDLARTGNLQFVSGVLDLTIKNTSADILELDMYEIYFKGTRDLGQNLGRTIEDCYQAVLDSQTAKGGLGPQIVTSRGWTPFNCGAASPQLGLKIYKKTKFFIGGGQVITHQKRDPKSHWIGYNQSVWQKDVWAKKFSYLCMFVGKSTPGGTGECSYVVGCTRSYNAKMYQFSGDTDQLVA